MLHETKRIRISQTALSPSKPKACKNCTHPPPSYTRLSGSQWSSQRTAHPRNSSKTTNPRDGGSLDGYSEQRRTRTKGASKDSPPSSSRTWPPATSSTHTEGWKRCRCGCRCRLWGGLEIGKRGLWRGNEGFWWQREEENSPREGSEGVKMAAGRGREREKGRASVMIRRCFNDSGFLWQRACRGRPPRRPASVSTRVEGALSGQPPY